MTKRLSDLHITERKILCAIAAQPYRLAAHYAGVCAEERPNTWRVLRSLEEYGLVSRGGRKRNVMWRLTRLGHDVVQGGGFPYTDAQYATSDDSADTDLQDDASDDTDLQDDTSDDSADTDAQCADDGDDEPTSDDKSDDGEITHPVYAKMRTYIEAGMPAIWLTGEAGTGKTYAVAQAARLAHMKLFVVTPVMDKYELMGYSDAQGNPVVTQIAEWARHDGPAVLLLDEVDGNMAPALLALNSLLANRIGVFPGGEVIHIGDDKIVIATANTTGHGPTIRYNSRQALDGAFVDRFWVKLHWGQHDDTERKIARKVIESKKGRPFTRTVNRSVDASFKIRANIEANGLELMWGPRRTYALCAAVCAGIPLREAAVDCGLSDLTEDDIQRALQGVM